LLLRDISLLSKIETLRDELAQEREINDVVDSQTGLIDRNSFVKDLGLIVKAVKDFGLDACVAAIRVDGLAGITADNAALKAQLIGSTGRLVQESCRDEDIIGHINNDYVGVILFDCSATDAQVVFNRVRMLRSSKPVMFEGEDFEITVSSAYLQVTSEDANTLVELCANKLLEQDSGGNRIYEV